MSDFTAFKISMDAFKDKVDLAGIPYRFHINRVAANFDMGSTLSAIAYLHDILEDCHEWNAQRLSEQFNPVVVNAVVALTKIKGEDYTVYLNRVAQNENATKVKIADLRDNMDISRFKRPLTEKDFERLKKYHNAYLFLIEKQTQFKT